jgi:micrococcal nuclease
MASEFQRLFRKRGIPRFRRPRLRVVRPARQRGRFWPFALMAPLAGFTAAWLWDVGPSGMALPLPETPLLSGGPAAPPGPRSLAPLNKRPLLSHGPATPDRESASFARCGMGSRHSCVIDGDTFWYQGSKIRIADINTPETSSPKCAYEAQLGEQATRRLIELLNAGAFTLEPIDREADRYGRTLRVVTRGGQSIGATLEAEGLAEHWRGYRREWC